MCAHVGDRSSGRPRICVNFLGCLPDTMGTVRKHHPLYGRTEINAETFLSLAWRSNPFFRFQSKHGRELRAQIDGYVSQGLWPFGPVARSDFLFLIGVEWYH
jgi:hypothetical protein